MADELDLSCPVPTSRYDRVVMAHGGGGRAMRSLIEEIFHTRFGAQLNTEDDAAVVELGGPQTQIVVTTDGFTVDPLFFPGGDIGRLAVCGTINDVAVAGARPRSLTAAFILEEGLALSDLEHIVDSMAQTAREAEVAIVTGDTKVVERGRGHGVFITTTGLGTLVGSSPLSARSVCEGDRMFVTGPVGDHGLAVVSAREGLRHSTPLVSDVAPLGRTVVDLVGAGLGLRCLRDPTRGGLATALCELANTSGLDFHLDDRAIPIRPTVADACELLGLDPLYAACEGQLCGLVSPVHAEALVERLHASGHPEATLIGTAAEGRGEVVLKSVAGGRRVLDVLHGDQLPRIC